ncbi:hypothetical protein Tco_0831227 [Tanacetum coccineum]
MRRLPHRLKADVKAAIKVAGFYKGCHIAKKVATLLKRLYRGYGLNILHKTNPNRGSYEGKIGLIVAGPTDGATDYAKRGTYQAPMRKEYRVVKVSLHTLVMASLFIGRDTLTVRLREGAFYGAFEGPLRDLLQGLLRGLRGEGQGVFEEKVGGFDRDFYRDKAKGFDRAFYWAFEDKVGGLLLT